MERKRMMMMMKMMMIVMIMMIMYLQDCDVCWRCEYVNDFVTPCI
jgi:hypothetical protein